MSRPLVHMMIAATGFAIIAGLAPVAAATGWRISFLTAGGPVVGAVLMLAIAKLTGAEWPGFVPLVAAMPVIAIAAIGIGVIQLAAPPPAHLGVWQHPLAVGLRAVAATGTLGWAGWRIAHGASELFSALTLAAYTLLVTAVASDWMLGGAPGHAVSAIGMVLFVAQIGGTCAIMLVLGRGSERFRQDMAKMLAATGLGLGYLVFMDYLIAWYGDLPAKIGWYVARAGLGVEGLAVAALVLGLVVPIAALVLFRGATGQRIAGLSALGGLLLFNLWWAGGGVIAFAAAAAAIWLLVSASLLALRQRAAHG